jgi:hypothetical protein
MEKFEQSIGTAGAGSSGSPAVPQLVNSPSASYRFYGGGGRTRTYDLRIMSPEAPIPDKEDTGLRLAESGKALQNPQLPRNQEQPTPDEAGDEHLPRRRR